MAIHFGNREVPCYRNLNLLAHAQLEEIEIGSRCGGFGECGGDRIRIVRGGEFLSPISNAEREHLSEAEIAEGFRLGCQTFPNSDDAEIWIAVG